MIRAKIVALILAAFGPVHGPHAVKVATCESGLRVDAVSGRYGSVGLFQADYSAHHRRGETWAAFRRRMSNPRANIAFAVRLSNGGRSWTHWRWSQRCWSRS